MRKRTSLLLALAASATAVGFAVPMLAPASAGISPRTAVADRPGSGQSVLDWNQQLISILGRPGPRPAKIHPTRSFAMLQAAEYDAVNSITRSGTPYRAVKAPADARPDAAADEAAHDVLLALYPSMRSGLDARLRGQLADIPEGRPKDDGVRVGRAAAQQILTLRASDGSSAVPAHVAAGTRPGSYRPTPPTFAAPVYTSWGKVTPFVLGQPRQYRPAAPPAVSSARYASALDEVRSLGRASSATRGADETVAAKLWSGAPVWTTWNQVAQRLLGGSHASLTEATAVLSDLDLSLADTTIALYDAKYHWRVWRPVTAIRLGVPGDPAIVRDPTWIPLTKTAPDPSYPGAHSAISEAAASVLAAFYGTHQSLAISSVDEPGVTRRFGSLSAAADEAGLSRIWAGQHTRIDHRAGQMLGQEVAAEVQRRFPAHRHAARR
jgi:membrane-associated phospholipid phosphatase